MKKTIWIVGILVIALVIGGFVAYKYVYPPVTVRVLTFKPVDYTGWKTYYHKILGVGITVKYPPGYIIDLEKEEKEHPEIDYSQMDGFGIFSEDFVFSSPSGKKGGIFLLGINVLNQPIAPGAPVYSNIRDYYTSDAEEIVTHKNFPSADLVRLGNQEAIHIISDEDDGSPHQSYYLMDHGHMVVLTIWVKESPYLDGVLQSIQFDK